MAALDVPLALLVALGVLLGVLFALAILVANMAAVWLVRDSLFLDALVRLGVFGAITVALATVVGAYLGPSIRAAALWFWLAFFLGFAGTPFVFALMGRHRGQSAG